ncbi:MAG TPA: hypothetical protein VGH19_02530 [Verrucomicrobiae bacterium]
MKNQALKRRWILNAVLLGLGIFASNKATAATKAKPLQDVSLEGEWFGEDGRICAVFRQGRVLLVVNPLGSIGVAHMVKPNSMVVVGGSGWDKGLTGHLSADGKRIDWSNSTAWLKS